jgi:hypothetical protein
VLFFVITLDSIGFRDQFLVNEATPHLNISLSIFSKAVGGSNSWPKVGEIKYGCKSLKHVMHCSLILFPSFSLIQHHFKIKKIKIK